MQQCPIPDHPADIGVPVDLWYGLHDTSPTHLPDLGTSLVQLILTAQRHVSPAAAGALLWTHTEAILRCLLRHVRLDALHAERTHPA